jgi:multisubunit Na+/H+ antiporter MnhB subunit
MQHSPGVRTISWANLTLEESSLLTISNCFNFNVTVLRGAHKLKKRDGIVGILQWLKSWLTASKRSSDGLGHPDLHPIDIEHLTRELDLLSKAKELGTKGLPAADAKMLTGSEADIVRTIERHRQGNVEWAVRRLAVLSESLTKRRVTQQVNQARQADEEFTRNANLRLAEFEAGLIASGKQARVHQGELAQFKAENRLSRQSRHHTTARSVLTYVLAVLFIVIEGVANALTFAQGLDTGWLGGLSQAVMFAATNVVIAFLFGKFFVRQVFHISWIRKLGGCLATALGLVIVCFMALLITHYRDALATGAEDAGAAALTSLWAQPFAFADIFSVLLCVLSFFFGLAALADGLLSDDLYPGYGAASRRTTASLDEYEANLAEAREELEALKEKALAEFEEALSRSQGVIATVQNGIADKRTTASRLATAMQDADHSLIALLRRFRTENEKHRDGVRRPAYFDEYPSLPPVPLPDFDVQQDVESLNAQRTIVEALVNEAQAIRARIQASFSHQFDSLKTLDANFASKDANNG